MTPAAALPSPPKRDVDGFILPHSIEAERATLGAAMVSTAAADYVCDQLTAEAYFRRTHQTLFAAVRVLRDRKSAIDLLTLKTYLNSIGKLDDVGGPVYLAGLADGVPTSTNVAHYAGILRDLRVKRALVAYANRTIDLVAEGSHSAPAIVTDSDRRLMELQASHLDGRMAPLASSASALSADLEWRVAHRGELTGVETGFPSINELTLGWQPGDLIVLGARPSIGKTSFALNAAVHAAQAGRRVAIFSLEMRRRQLEYRILAQLSGLPLTRLLGGYLGDPDYGPLSAAMGIMWNLPIEIDDRAGQSAWDVRGACRRLKAKGGLDLVVIDYVQLMPGTLDRRGATRNEEITDISRRMKGLADEVDVPVLLLSQLNRANEQRSDPRPKLSDLRESGALEQDADLVCFLHRKNHREGGTTAFIFEKQRNGPTGTVNLTLDRDITTFTDGGEEPPATVEPPTKVRAPRLFAGRARHGE